MFESLTRNFDYFQSVWRKKELCPWTIYENISFRFHLFYPIQKLTWYEIAKYHAELWFVFKWVKQSLFVVENFRLEFRVWTELVKSLTMHSNSATTLSKYLFPLNCEASHFYTVSIYAFQCTTKFLAQFCYGVIYLDEFNFKTMFSTRQLVHLITIWITCGKIIRH